MSARYTHTFGARTYTLADDETWVYRVIIGGTVRDPITGGVFRRPFGVTTDHPLLKARTHADGLYSASGYVERALRDAANAPTDVRVTVSARGFRTASEVVTIAPGASLPITAPPLDLVPTPISVQGRVMRVAPRQPVAGASVTLVNPNFLALRTPLQFPHARSVTVEDVPLAPDALVRRLLRPTVSGSNLIVLDDVSLLAPGALLVIDSNWASEYRVIDRLDGPTVHLQSPLQRTFGAGIAAQRIGNPGPLPGAQQAPLAQESHAGDGVLLLSAALNVAQVRIIDGGRTEYRAVGARTDAQGFYGLSGVTRVNVATWRAVGPAASNVTMTVNYDRPINNVEFRL